MLIQLKTEVTFQGIDGRPVKVPAGSYANYSSYKIEPDEFMHIVTAHDKRTGGRLRHAVRMPSCSRPVYL
jgi:hypothetical protein